MSENTDKPVMVGVEFPDGVRTYGVERVTDAATTGAYTLHDAIRNDGSWRGERVVVPIERIVTVGGPADRLEPLTGEREDGPPSALADAMHTRDADAGDGDGGGDGDPCPECGRDLIHSMGGRKDCRDCGWTNTDDSDADT